MAENLIGKTFNLLEVIDGPIRKNNKIYWRCRCDCGIEKDIRSDGLKNGTTKSCGCFKKKVLIQGNIDRQTADLQDVRFGKLIAKEKTNKRNSDGRVIWNCLCDCGNWVEANSHDLQQNKIQSCGCLRSKGEFIISQILQANNIPFMTQKTFENCKFEDSGYYARFDFYINNQYLIEYDGEQHFYYKSNLNTWNTEQNYLRTLAHDEYKNQWCKENNIPLIRIPYTQLENITIKDLLLETTQFRII